MIRKTSHSNGKRYVYYLCCRGCKGARISEDALTESVTATIRSQIANILNLERILVFIDTLPLKRDEVQKLDGQVVEKRMEIERCERMVFSLYESLESGVLTEAEFRQMKIRYNALRDEAELAVNNLSREIEDIISCGGEKKQWIEHFKQYKDFEELNRRMVISLIDVITIHPGRRLEILFRYRYDYDRAISFAEAVTKLHTIPEDILLGEVS